MPNSERKAAAGLKARFDQEDQEEFVDPMQFEKQKVFKLVMDTSQTND